MKATTTAAFFALLAVISLAAFQQGAALTCSDVNAALMPCIQYLTGREGSPSAPCCDGVSTVKGMAQTPADRRAACNCVKAAAGMFASIRDDVAQSLPDKCSVKIDIPISRTVDCDRIN